MQINSEIKRIRQWTLSRLTQGAAWAVVAALLSASAAPPRIRTVQLVYKTSIGDLPAGTRKLELWVPVPHNGPFQQITDLTIDAPYPYQLDSAQYGNRMLHLSVNNPPREGFAITMQFTAARQERIAQTQSPGDVRAGSLPPPDGARWL